MMVWKWYDWMIVVWWFVRCVCEVTLQTVVKKTQTLFLVFFKLRNTTQSTSLSFRFLQLFYLPTWLDDILKTSEDQVIKPSVVIRFDVVYPRVSPEDPEEQKCSFLFFLLSIILKYKKVFRVFIKSANLAQTQTKSRLKTTPTQSSDFQHKSSWSSGTAVFVHFFSNL